MTAQAVSPAPMLAERARLAVSAIFLVNGALFATWAVNIPSVRDHLNLSAGEIGWALLAIGLGSLCSMPLVGGIIARWGSDRLTQLMVVLTMLALALPFFMPNLWALGAALALLGALNGALDVSMNAQGVTVEKALGRPIMSRLHAYFSLGGVVGAALGTLLVGRVPMQTHVLLVVVLTTLTGLVAGKMLLPDAPHSMQTHVPETTGTEAAGTQAAPTQPTQSKAAGLGLTGPVLLLGSLCFLGMLSEGANYDWAALYFRDALKLPLSQAGLGYAAFVTCMTLGRWFGDQFRARFGDEKMVRGGALLTSLGLGLALLVHQPLVATLGFAISGLGLSNVVPVMYGTAGHALASRGIAMVATIGYGGFLLGPPLIGFVAQHAGLTAALAIALAAALLVALLGGQAFRLVRANASVL